MKFVSCLRWSAVVSCLTLISCGCPERRTRILLDVTDTVECCAAVRSFLVTPVENSNLDIAAHGLTLGEIRVNVVNPQTCPTPTSCPLVGGRSGSGSSIAIGANGARGVTSRIDVFGDKAAAVRFRLVVVSDSGICT